MANEIKTEHISYLHKLADVADKYSQISATRKMLVLDMLHHGLVRIEDDFILLEKKAMELGRHLEAEAKNFLNSPQHNDHG